MTIKPGTNLDYFFLVFAFILLIVLVDAFLIIRYVIAGIRRRRREKAISRV